MNFLVVHQNYPGQFKYLAPALARRGHRVVAVPLQDAAARTEHGVEIKPYVADRSSSKEIHRWLSDFETKVIRGENCYRHCQQLASNGFKPDAIIAHPGWGESLFLKELWPEVPMGTYCEFFYAPAGTDINFDPEFPRDDFQEESCRIKLKNLNNLLHEPLITSGISPTAWQASTFPESVRNKITVVHDGIDTSALTPKASAYIETTALGRLSKGDEVVTFVSRNLEPYRGFHIFLRALPRILRAKPNAKVVIIGAEGKGYGANPPEGITWKQKFQQEVAATQPDTDWSRVSFLGKLPYDQFKNVLKVSAVHVYLTYPFVASWSLLEAMSTGAAVIGSQTPPVQEFIEHNHTGVLTDFFDHNALADNVIELLNDPDRRVKLGVAARELIIDQYDLSSVCLPRQIEWAESLYC